MERVGGRPVNEVDLMALEFMNNEIGDDPSEYVPPTETVSNVYSNVFMLVFVVIVLAAPSLKAVQAL